MKMIIVGDLHFGVKTNIPEFIEYQSDEFDKMIQYAIDNNIDKLCFLGDIFDNRNSINIRVLKMIRDKFQYIADNTKINVITIIGNHDTFYKNTNKLNSPTQIFRGLHPDQFMFVANDTFELIIGDSLCLFVPWMNKDDFEKYLDVIEESPATYCFGHFEINNFVMNNQNKCKSQLKAKSFKNFRKVFSGHFHTKSQKKNIVYTGSLCQMDWSDFEVDKGFYVLDTKTHQIEFVKSDINVFRKILVGDKFDFETIKDIQNSFLKVYLNKKLKNNEHTRLSALFENNISYELIDNTILDDIDKIEIDKEDDLTAIVEACVNEQDHIIAEDKNQVIELINKFYDEMKLGK